jgi:hypothetical protein
MKSIGLVAVLGASFALLVASLLVACGVVQYPADQPTEHPTSVATPPETVPSPTLAPSPNAAYSACSAIIDNIPMVTVRSGNATIAAAYEVTGEQMSRYFVEELDHSGGSNGADWWNSPTKIVDMCVLDGDFETQTPGPPGHDTTATRVLVVVDGGDAFPWAFCFSNMSCGIPTTDPATIAGR